MTTALFIALALLALAYAVQRNRAANIEFDRDMLRDQLAELAYQLDDATRERDRLAKSNACLIRENNTLLVDLCHSETRAAYLESLHMARKGETAGIVLTKFLVLVNPRKKMTVEGRAP